MTREDIIRMAREAGFTVCRDEWVLGEMLERFAKLVRDDYSNKHANLCLDRCHAFMRAEREACAKMCENMTLEWEDQPSIAQAELATMMDCALAIRSRGPA
jgi:hypothetical protein